MNFLEFIRNTKQKILTQSLPGYRKKPLDNKFLIFFIILGIVNTTLGIILFIPYTSIYNINIPYTTGESINEFTITKQTKPLYLYLQIKGFYQSYSLYAKSFSENQLKGEATTKIGSCKPLKYSEGKIIYPCGLIANSFNQDLFVIPNVIINTEDISWSSTENRIKNTSYNLDQIVAPPLWQPYDSVPLLGSNRRFANWMSSASFPNFRKLYGKIDNGLSPGTYFLIINSDFQYGEKSVFLSESSWAGMRNYFLATLMIIIGSLMILFSRLIWLKIDQLR